MCTSSLAEEIKRIYSMVDAFFVPDNVNDAPELVNNNDVAEWIIYVDPHAAGLWSPLTRRLPLCP